MNSNSNKIVISILLSISFCVSCGSLSSLSSSEQVEARYSHTELSVGKHFLAYSGVLAMTLETAAEKWLAKAERLCKSREFEYEFDKEEFRGKDFSENKYPYIEGKLTCNKLE